MHTLRQAKHSSIDKMKTPLQGTPPTDDDTFYLEWGKETTKKNIESAHGVLTQFLTLNTALMGGSVAFFTQGSINKSLQLSALFCFFIGLLVSFLGVLPYESNVSPISPSEIKDHKEISLKRKRFFMWLTAVFTGAGLLCISIGAFCA